MYLPYQKYEIRISLTAQDTSNVEVLDFLMNYESYLRRRRISVSSRRYKPTENIVVIRYVSVIFLSLSLSLSLSRLFACKLIDVFSFHLQIFHLQRLMFTTVGVYYDISFSSCQNQECEP
jgi:hypothetical protein